MNIFDFEDHEALGHVRSVDTATVLVSVDDVEKLRKLQVNRLVILQSSRPGQYLIGIIQKITRTAIDGITSSHLAQLDEIDENIPPENNVVKITLIGTHVDKLQHKENIFLRTLETVPEIDANCFALEGEKLTAFMRAIANIGDDNQRLSLGCYTLDDKADAFLNGNKFFQRHAVIVGSTGSGKSWTTARVLGQVAKLDNANAIVIDVHGEYTPLLSNGVRHFRIAGPSDLDKKSSLDEGVIYLPYWLLSYEAITSMFVDRSDQNSPNQTMVMSRAIVDAKRKYLSDGGHKDILENFTIDSPIQFDIQHVLDELNALNVEMVAGSSGKEKQGDFHGKLSRLIQRLENKKSDRRLGFLFRGQEETLDFNWLDKLVKALLAGTADQDDKKGGVKIIDFSEVPSDILPLIVSLVAKIAFSVQQWTPIECRHPLAIFCDEAHLYIPERTQTGSSGDVSVDIFERIAKEGRKYGVGLVVISQRPSEVNRTVLSQCSNLIAMRLTNGEDQSVVRRLLPDSLGGFGDLLPVLDTGEALVVGDASILPTRIRVAEPEQKPNSGTVNFWDRWTDPKPVENHDLAVDGWRKQTMQSIL